MNECTDRNAAVETETNAQDAPSAAAIDPDQVSGGCESRCAASIAGGAVAGLASGAKGVALGILGGVIAGCDGPGMNATGSGNIGNDVIAA